MHVNLHVSSLQSNTRHVSNSLAECVSVSIEFCVWS